MTTLAGSGSAGYADGTGTGAVLSNPASIVYDSSTDSYLFCDAGNHRIRRVTRAGVVTTVAGSGTATRTDGTGTAAAFNQPRYMTAAPGPIFYISEWAGCAVRRMTTAGVVTTIAALTGCGVNEGLFGIAWRPADSQLYVADYLSCTIKSVTLGGTVTVVAGSSGSCTFADGSLTAARFRDMHGLEFGAQGQLLVADRNNNRIREIDLDGGTVGTLAGSGTAGSTDGIGTAATLYYPMDVRMAQHGGYVLATDFDTGAVRKIA